MLPPRRRTTVDYSEKRRTKRRSSADDDYDFEAEGDGAVDLTGAGGKKSKKSNKKNSAPPEKKWSMATLKSVLGGLLRFGMDIERFEASSVVMDSFTSKRFEKGHVMEVARFVAGVWETVAREAPGKPPSKTYLVRQDASEEVLARLDAQVLDRIDEHDALVIDVGHMVLRSLPPLLARLRELVPSDTIPECFEKPDFYFEMIESAGHMMDHIDGMAGLQRRAEKEAKLPKVIVKGTPAFWNAQTFLNTDEANDRHLLKRIVELGWEFSMRRSKGQEDTLMSIIETDDFYSTMRDEFLGTPTAPPTSASFVTEDQWRESPDFAYKQLLSVLYNRVRSYMKECGKLERVRRAMSSLPAITKVTGTGSGTGTGTVPGTGSGGPVKHAIKPVDLYAWARKAAEVGSGRPPQEDEAVDLT